MKLSLAFVLSGLTALAMAAPASHGKPKPSPAPKPAPVNDITILNFALTLEYLEAAFYAEGLALYSEDDFTNAGFSPVVRERLVQTGQQEQAHVDFLVGALGKKADKACTYKFPFSDAKGFVELAAAIEGVGVSAYAGAAPLISAKNILGYAAQILPVEARHQAIFAEILGDNGSPNAYDTPLGLSPVFNIAAQFIDKCPKTNTKFPVKIFESLGATVDGSTVTLNFTRPKGCKPKLYAYILNGLISQAIPLKADNTFELPGGNQISGRVYVLVTDSTKLSDATTVAGPAFFEVDA